jgi:hypothetical protein
MNDLNPNGYNDLFEEMSRAEDQNLIKHVYTKGSKLQGDALFKVRTLDSFLEIFSDKSGIPPIVHPD